MDPLAVYLPKLPPACDEEWLMRRFTTFGKIAKLDRKSYFAFVNFESAVATERALAARVVGPDGEVITVLPRTVPAAATQQRPPSQQQPRAQPPPPAAAGASKRAPFEKRRFPDVDADQKCFAAHAEDVALRYMRWLGFDDARAVGGPGDRGIDVCATHAVAQVKWRFHGAAIDRRVRPHS